MRRRRSTTGHEWDGIKELNSPLPKWWLYVFYATIVWSIGYWVVYPSWPLISSYTSGTFGWSSRASVHKELDSLKSLRAPLIAKLVVEGFINGLHKSPFHGFSVEFADHREYAPGDDLKYLDWQVYARTDRYYIKRYEEETNLRCYLMLDRSASMGFGTGSMTKFARA